MRGKKDAVGRVERLTSDDNAIPEGRAPRTSSSTEDRGISRRHMVQRAAGIAALAGGLPLLSACGSNAADEKSSGGSGKLMGDGEEYPVVYYLTSLGYWDMHFAGLKDVGDLLNIKFKKLGPTNADIAAETLAMEQATAQNPKGMIVAAIDDSVIGKSIDKAIKKGIPVVTMDAPAFSSQQDSYIGTGNQQAGFDCGKRLIKAIGGSGTVLVTTTTVAAPAKAQRLEGFKQAIAETNGKVKIAAQVDDGDVAETAAKSVGQALQAHPDVSGIFTISAGAGLGTAQAVSEAGKDKLPVLAFGNDDAAYRLTKKQNLTMVAQDGYKMGFMCGLLIHCAAAGLIKPRYKFESLGVSALPQTVDTGIHFVDAKTADAFIGCKGC
jgi:ribose transport system substrate-binding protein